MFMYLPLLTIIWMQKLTFNNKGLIKRRSEERPLQLKEEGARLEQAFDVGNKLFVRQEHNYVVALLDA
jgi:hypothetical protein